LEKTDIVLIMLNDAEAIQTTLFSDEKIMKKLSKQVIVQMSTIGSTEAVIFDALCKQNNSSYIECPVLGSTPAASGGTLVLLLSAPKEISEREDVKAVLKTMGTINPISCEIGKSAAVKLSLNQIIAMHMSAISLGASIVQEHGIPLDTFWDVLKNSPIHSKYFDFKHDRLQQHNHSNPNFINLHLLKDINLALNEARLVGLDGSGLEGARKLTESAIKLGYGNDDCSALMEAVLQKKKE